MSTPSPISVGAVIPPTAANVKEESPASPTPLNLKGKNVIVGVPGAFTYVCHGQIPEYIAAAQEFQSKGVGAIYVVAVNDVFVMKAWKENLAPDGTDVHFISDDQGKFTDSLGLLFDARSKLGTHRSLRYTMVVEDERVVSLDVEDDPTKVTVTAAKAVLAKL